LTHPATATEAEAAFLGSLVLMGSASHKFSVTPDMFFDAANRTMCKAINAMQLAETPIDAVTLGEHLAASGDLEYIGGVPRIIHTLDATPGTHNVEHYAAAIKTAYEKRELQYTVQRMRSFVASGEFDYDEAIELVRDAGRQRPTKGRSALPVSELIEQFPEMRPAIIENLLRRGETMNLVSGTKIGKSWLAIGLAICISTGRQWLSKFETTKGRVLHIDTELHPETLSNRIREVAEAMNVPTSELADYKAFPVRGKGWSVNNLSDEISEHRPDIVLIDALYRAVPRGQDENSNREMAEIYNAIDEAADHYEAGVILVHHTTKGSQAGKANTDIGSGAGAMSRAVDTHATLVRSEEEGQDEIMLFQASLRSWAPIDAIPMVRSHPLWVPMGSIPTHSHGDQAARRLMKESPKSTDATTDEMIDVVRKILRKHGKSSRKEISGHWIAESGGLPLPTGGSMGRLLKRAVESGRIEMTGKAPKSFYKLSGTITEF